MSIQRISRRRLVRGNTVEMIRGNYIQIWLNWMATSKPNSPGIVVRSKCPSICRISRRKGKLPSRYAAGIFVKTPSMISYRPRSHIRWILGSFKSSSVHPVVPGTNRREDGIRIVTMTLSPQFGHDATVFRRSTCPSIVKSVEPMLHLFPRRG